MVKYTEEIAVLRKLIGLSEIAAPRVVPAKSAAFVADKQKPDGWNGLIDGMPTFGFYEVPAKPDAPLK